MNRQRVHRSRRSLQLELLEVRRVFSAGVSFAQVAAPAPLGPNLTVLGISPADGSTVFGSTTSIAVAFDRPLDPSWLGLSDLSIEQIGPDGSLSLAVDPNVAMITENLDPTGTQLIYSFDQPLAPGRYEVILSDQAWLTGLDGSNLASAGSTQTVGSFQVAAPGVSFSDAIELGALTPTPMPTSGKLDFQANPFAVNLYRFELTPDHARWRLGAEIDAHRNGSPLNAAITVFDAQGHPLASQQLGRSDFPSDPFLFRGLPNGTYYIGVSGAGNIGGAPGGYNPATGDPGTVGQAQAGGAYTLQLVADQADTPTAPIGFRVDHADPKDPNPTGFQVQFSGPIDVQSQGTGGLFDRLSSGVQLVDQHGRAWPIAAVGYQESASTLTFIFREALPQGSYTVRIPSQGGLVDLAGNTPRLGDRTDGVLGRFSVTAPTPTQTSSDLGPLYPNDVLSTIPVHVDVPAGKTVLVRFVALYDDYYIFRQTVSGGSLEERLLGADGNTGNDKSGTVLNSASDRVLVHLTPGVHYISLRANGGQAAHLDLRLSIPAFGWESSLLNGIGQGPALGLRLVAPTAILASPSSGQATSVTDLASGGGSTVFSSPTTTAQPGPSLGNPTGSSGSSTSEGSLTTGASTPTGVSLTYGAQPVGMPSADAARVAAVGPVGGTGAVALASSGDLATGIGFGQVMSSGASTRGNDSGAGVLTDGAIVRDAALQDLYAERGQTPNEAVDAVVPSITLPQLEHGAAAAVAEILDKTDRELAELDEEPGVPRRLQDLAAFSEESETDRAGQGLALSFLAAVAFHYRHSFRRRPSAGLSKKRARHETGSR